MLKKLILATALCFGGGAANAEFADFAAAPDLTATASESANYQIVAHNGNQVLGATLQRPRANIRDNWRLFEAMRIGTFSYEVVAQTIVTPAKGVDCPDSSCWFIERRDDDGVWRLGLAPDDEYIDGSAPETLEKDRPIWFRASDQDTGQASLDGWSTFAPLLILQPHPDVDGAYRIREYAGGTLTNRVLYNNAKSNLIVNYGKIVRVDFSNYYNIADYHADAPENAFRLRRPVGALASGLFADTDAKGSDIVSTVFRIEHAGAQTVAGLSATLNKGQPVSAFEGTPAFIAYFNNMFERLQIGDTVFPYTTEGLLNGVVFGIAGDHEIAGCDRIDGYAYPIPGVGNQTAWTLCRSTVTLDPQIDYQLIMKQDEANALSWTAMVERVSDKKKARIGTLTFQDEMTVWNRPQVFVSSNETASCDALETSTYVFQSLTIDDPSFGDTTHSTIGTAGQALACADRMVLRCDNTAGGCRIKIR